MGRPHQHKKKEVTRLSLAEEKKTPHRLWAQPWFTERVGKATDSLGTLKAIGATGRSLGEHMDRRVGGLRLLRLAQFRRISQAQSVGLAGGLSHIRHLGGVGLRTAAQASGLRSLHLLLGAPPANSDALFAQLIRRNGQSLRRFETSSGFHATTLDAYPHRLEMSKKMEKVLPALMPNVKQLKIAHDVAEDIRCALHLVQVKKLQCLTIETSPRVTLKQQIAVFATSTVGTWKSCRYDSSWDFSSLLRLAAPEECLPMTKTAPRLHSLRVVLSRPAIWNLLLIVMLPIPLAPVDFWYDRSLGHLASLRLLSFDLRRLQDGVCDFSSFNLGGLGVEAVELRMLEEAGTCIGLGDLWTELGTLAHLRRLVVRSHVDRIGDLAITNLRSLEALKLVFNGDGANSRIPLPPALRRLEIESSGADVHLWLEPHPDLRRLSVTGPAHLHLLGGLPALADWRLGQATGTGFWSIWDKLGGGEVDFPLD